MLAFILCRLSQGALLGLHFICVLSMVETGLVSTNTVMYILDYPTNGTLYAHTNTLHMHRLNTTFRSTERDHSTLGGRQSEPVYATSTVPGYEMRAGYTAAPGNVAVPTIINPGYSAGNSQFVPSEYSVPVAVPVGEPRTIN